MHSATHLTATLSFPTKVIQSLVTVNCAVTSEISLVSISIPRLVPIKTINKLSASQYVRVTKPSELKSRWTLFCKSSSRMLKHSPQNSILKLSIYPTESPLLTGWTTWQKSYEYNQRPSIMRWICSMHIFCVPMSLATLVNLLTSKVKPNRT